MRCEPAIGERHTGAAPLTSPGFTTLEWIPPLHAELAGFKVYWGPGPQDYREVRAVGLASRCDMGPLPRGRYYFSVTALDATGKESSFSNEISREVR